MNLRKKVATLLVTTTLALAPSIIFASDTFQRYIDTYNGRQVEIETMKTFRETPSLNCYARDIVLKTLSRDINEVEHRLYTDLYNALKSFCEGNYNIRPKEVNLYTIRRFERILDEHKFNTNKGKLNNEDIIFTLKNLMKLVYDVTDKEII